MTIRLAMPNVDKQRHNRASLNSVRTRVGSTGFPDAAREVWRKAVPAMESPDQDVNRSEALEAFEPRRLADEIRARISGRPEFSDPVTDARALSRCLGSLDQLAARRSPKLERELMEASASVVQESALRIRQALGAAFASRPSHIGEVVEETREILARIELPEGSDAPHREFARLLRLWSDLKSRKSSVTAKTMKTVGERLLQRARETYELALTELALGVCVKSVASARDDLDKVLDDHAQQGAGYTEHLNRITLALEVIQIQAKSEVENSRATCVLVLEGPSQNEVLAAVRAHHEAADLGDLTRRILEQLETRLRTTVVATNPALRADTPFTQVLLALGASEIAAEIVRLIEEGAGDSFSLYELLERQGLGQCARYLWERASDTCHLEGRNAVEFGITTSRVAVVRLPPPRGRRDPRIMGDLREIFESYAKGSGFCQVVEGAEGDRDIEVFRTCVGWPIGVEGQNLALLGRYSRAAGRGHPPHLVDLLPESPLGEALPEYLELIGHLGKREQSDDQN